MPPFSSLVTTAATMLSIRRRAGDQGVRLPVTCRPLDTDTALAIQSAVTAQLGERIGAWKCGLPFDGNMVLAPIHAGTICTDSCCPVWTYAGQRGQRGQRGQIRVEPELAFILGHDLPPRDAPYLPQDVDAAIARTHLALELIGSRYADPGAVNFAENLADGLLNQGLLIGPQVDAEQARSAAGIPITVQPEAELPRCFNGQHPNADPRMPLYWLAEFLRGRGQGLQAGQAVITGSYAGSFDLPVGQRIAIRYGALGELTVCFSPK